MTRLSVPFGDEKRRTTAIGAPDITVHMRPALRDVPATGAADAGGQEIRPLAKLPA